MKIPILWWIAPLSSIISIAFAYYFHKQVSKKNPGNDRMQEIAGYVREGSFAYLKQQYKGVAIFFLLAFLLFNFMAWGLKLLDPLIPFAFLTGGFSAV